VPGNAVAFDQREKVRRSVPAERGLREVRILRKVAIRRGVQVGEVAAPAAGNQDLLARPVGMVEQQYTLAALTGRGGAEQPGGSGAEYNSVVFHHAQRHSSFDKLRTSGRRRVVFILRSG